MNSALLDRAAEARSLESSIKINDNDIVTKSKEDEALKEQTDAFEAFFKASFRCIFKSQIHSLEKMPAMKYTLPCIMIP